MTSIFHEFCSPKVNLHISENAKLPIWAPWPMFMNLRQLTSLTFAIRTMYDAISLFIDHWTYLEYIFSWITYQLWITLLIFIKAYNIYWITEIRTMNQWYNVVFTLCVVKYRIPSAKIKYIEINFHVLHIIINCYSTHKYKMDILNKCNIVNINVNT